MFGTFVLIGFIVMVALVSWMVIRAGRSIKEALRPKWAERPGECPSMETPAVGRMWTSGAWRVYWVSSGDDSVPMLKCGDCGFGMSSPEIENYCHARGITGFPPHPRLNQSGQIDDSPNITKSVFHKPLN